MGKIEEINCGIGHIRYYPGCFEDCDYGDTDTCPHHKKVEPKSDESRLLTEQDVKPRTRKLSPLQAREACLGRLLGSKQTGRK